MNVKEASNALDFIIRNSDVCDYCQEDVDKLSRFISEAENLLKYNSIKQTPALFKEKK